MDLLNYIYTNMKVFMFLLLFSSGSLFAECEPCKTRYLKCKEIANKLPINKINCNKIDRNFYIDTYIDLQKSKFIEDEKAFDFCKTVYNDANDNLVKDVAQRHREDEDVLSQCFGGLSFQNATKEEQSRIKNTLKDHEKNFQRTKLLMNIFNGSIAIVCLWILFVIFF